VRNLISIEPFFCKGYSTVRYGTVLYHKPAILITAVTVHGTVGSTGAGGHSDTS
jgi:hypothetical protein